MLAGAVPASEIMDLWVKMLLYGPNGVGKTTLACGFEKPLLLVSLEPGKATAGGARSVRRIPGVTHLRITAADTETVSEKFVRLAHELRERNPFRTVVIDTVTGLQDIVLQEILGLDELPVQLNFGGVSGDAYRDRSEKCKTYLRPWLDLPCHTIFVGNERDHNPPKEERVNEKTGKVQPDMRPRFIRGLQQESFVTVDLGGGAAKWLMDGCDYICRLYMDRELKTIKVGNGTDTVETGRFVRALRIGYHPNFAARFRSDVPEGTPEAITDPTYEKIMAAIAGRTK